MAKDNQVLVRVNDPTNQAIEEFADTYDFTKAEAVRRMAEDRLAGEGYLDRPPGKPIPDGGQLANEIEVLQSQVGELNEETSQFRQTLFWLGIAMIWIGTDIVFNFSPAVMISTGIVVLIGLFYSSAKEMIRQS